jgi:hypothetical protein
MDATVKPPAGYDSDRSLRPLPSNDAPQHFNRTKRMETTRHRAHTPSVALGNSPPGYASGLLILPHGKAQRIAANIAKFAQAAVISYPAKMYRSVRPYRDARNNTKQF